MGSRPIGAVSDLVSSPRVFSAVLAVCAVLLGVVCAVLGAALLRGRHSGTLAVAVVAAAGAAACGVFTMGTLVGPWGFFGALHWIYLVFVISVPIGGAGLLVATRGQDGRVGVRFLGAVLVLPVLFGWWATHVEPGRLRVDRVEHAMGDGGSSGRPLRVGVLSDLQTTGAGSHEREAVERLVAERPDLVVVPGDVLQSFDTASGAEAVPGLTELFAELGAAVPVVAVPGHVDRGEELDAIMSSPGITVVQEGVAYLEAQGRRVAVGGVTADLDAPGTRSTIDELERIALQDPATLTLLVSHLPDVVLRMRPSSAIELVLSGHTHGGQVALPLLGPPLTLSEVPREVGAGGLHEVAGNAVYVSTGAGLERGYAPQVRFGVRPSIGIVTVR